MIIEPDYSAWRFWFNVGQYGITIVVAIYVWFSRRASATAKDVAQVKGSVETISITMAKLNKDVEVVKKTTEVTGNRVTTLEANTISHTDLGAVYDRINTVSDQVSTLTGAVEGIKGSVDMISEYLMNKGGNN